MLIRHPASGEMVTARYSGRLRCGYGNVRWTGLGENGDEEDIRRCSWREVKGSWDAPLKLNRIPAQYLAQGT